MTMPATHLAALRHHEPAPLRAERAPLRHLRAHLETWRPYTLAYPGLLGLAGAAAGGTPATGTWILVAAGACPTLGWLGGHYLGDYYDRNLDAISKPQRPIPSGRLTPKAARASGITAVLIAGGVTLLLNWPTLAGVLLALVGLVAYSKVLKKRGIWGNAMRGALTALAILFGAAITASPGQLPSWHAVPIAMVFLLHDTASNLVGTLRDTDGDRAGGYRTVPVQKGLTAATRTAAHLYTAALLLAAGAAVLSAHVSAYLLLLLPAAGAGATAFIPLVRSGARLHPRLALWGHEVLVAERMVLAAAVLAGAWGPLRGLGVLLPLLTFSLVAQHRMRAKHEYVPPPREQRSGAEPTAHQKADT
ncbi:UbiA family prenyltransferase [Streptomyces lydicus]|uniref:UbiA family prenyltransferase n=1 Tax=Streptomyces lydicus TaxID=47763 RepID=UPI0033EF3920